MDLDSSNFHRLSIAERRKRLAVAFPQLEPPAFSSEASWFDQTANLMVENCIGVVPLPLGLGLNLTLNGKSYAVPMAVEEPSVIAAASVAAKLVARGGGFQTQATANLMFGQVQLLDVDDPEKVIARVLREKDRLIALANTLCDSMKKRGGGVLDLLAKGFPKRGERPAMVIVYLQVDVCDAMGANVINTICEGIAGPLTEVSGARVGLRILSNLCTDRLATATFQVPTELFDAKTLAGGEVAKRIVEAWYFADVDPYRAVTHNKGILNGVDSVALATGQDWRAIESAAHAFAARDGQYRPLSSFAVRGDALWGELTLPLAVGTQGGALKSHPTYRYTHGLLGNPDAQTLAQIMVAVGLAQNLAALRALATDGIQAGHMPRHARNIAIAAGLPQELAETAAEYMTARGQIHRKGATDYLELVETHRRESPGETAPPSTASFRVTEDGGGEIEVRFPFRSAGTDPEHLHLGPARQGDPQKPDLLDEASRDRLQAAHAFWVQAHRALSLPVSATSQITLAALAIVEISRSLSRLLSVEERSVLAAAVKSGTLRLDFVERLEVRQLMNLLEGCRRCLNRHAESAGILKLPARLAGDEAFLDGVLTPGSSLWPLSMTLLQHLQSQPVANGHDQIRASQELGEYLERENFVAYSLASYVRGQDLEGNAYLSWLGEQPDDANARRAFCRQFLPTPTFKSSVAIERCVPLIWSFHGLVRPLAMPRSMSNGHAPRTKDRTVSSGLKRD